MEIQITEAMEKEIVKQVANRLYSHIRSCIDVEKLVQETAATIRKEVSASVAGAFHKRVNTDDLVEAALADANNRIRSRISNLLSKGVVVKIVEED